MKNLILILTIFLLQIQATHAQNKEIKTITIHVSGICGMCEERIENAVDVSGVKSAEWTKSNHQLIISYRADKINEEEIHRLLNEAGHDTEKSKATDEQYSRVHACCKYREDSTH